MIANGVVSGLRPRENSVIEPDGLTRPIAGRLPSSVNHRLPSGPSAIWNGTLPAFSPRV